MLAYGQSKTANVLFAVELDRRWAEDGIRGYAVHSGIVVTTNLGPSRKEDGRAVTDDQLRGMGLLPENVGEQPVLIVFAAMRWRDGNGDKWRLRQRRLAWPAKMPLGAAADMMPSGVGDDPISAIIALPGVAVLLVVLALWLVELVLRLLFAPVAMVLRLLGAISYRLDLFYNGRHVETYRVTGLSGLWRERRRLAAGGAYQG
jgi:hypothetical protein